MIEKDRQKEARISKEEKEAGEQNKPQTKPHERE